MAPHNPLERVVARVSEELTPLYFKAKSQYKVLYFRAASLYLDLKPIYLKHQRPILGVGAAVVLAFTIAIAAIFVGLPGREELRALGEMPQASTLYDVHNHPVFTI